MSTGGPGAGLIPVTTRRLGDVIGSVRWSQADAHTLSCTTDAGELHVFDTRAMTRAALSLHTHPQLYTHAFVSPNEVLLGFGDGRVRVLDVRMGTASAPCAYDARIGAVGDFVAHPTHGTTVAAFGTQGVALLRVACGPWDDDEVRAARGARPHHPAHRAISPQRCTLTRRCHPTHKVVLVGWVAPFGWRALWFKFGVCWGCGLPCAGLPAGRTPRPWSSPLPFTSPARGRTATMQHSGGYHPMLAPAGAPAPPPPPGPPVVPRPCQCRPPVPEGQVAQRPSRPGTQRTTKSWWGRLWRRRDLLPQRLSSPPAGET